MAIRQYLVETRFHKFQLGLLEASTNHMTMNVQNAPEPSGIPLQSSTWPCLPCNQSFSDAVTLTTHRRTHSHLLCTGPLNHYCLSCHPTKRLRCRKAWIKHRTKEHDIVNKAQGPDALFKQDNLRIMLEMTRCPYCPLSAQRYSARQDLELHMHRIHSLRHGKGQFMCTTCGNGTEMSSEQAAAYLQQHENSNEGRMQPIQQSFDNPPIADAVTSEQLAGFLRYATAGQSVQTPQLGTHGSEPSPSLPLFEEEISFTKALLATVSKE
jgi:hypothetical protein